MQVAEQQVHLYRTTTGFVELSDSDIPLTFYSENGSRIDRPRRFNRVRYYGSYRRVDEESFWRLVRRS